MKKSISLLLLGAALLSGLQVHAFCGFFVAKADAKLFNNRSEIILVRDGNRTVITMSNDFEGSITDFAMVVPVPVVLREDQIRVVDRTIFDQLDAYSGPRLVEYYDSNPCTPVYESIEVTSNFSSRAMTESLSLMEDRATELNVTIEAQYTIGEYDILLLSAKESTGLKTWLTENGYQIPDKADEVLQPYIRSNMKFFVVKVNLDQYLSGNSELLRPIQIEFEHERFMLPIRLGMANAKDAQDLVIYAFTKTGRVETTNYRTVKIPTDRNVPLYVQPKFGEFYKSLFDKAYKSEGRSSVFLEYAWNVSPQFGVKCDPCMGPPPMFAEFQKAGVNWLNNGIGGEVFFTRLHVRYTRDKFPQDLVFQVTPNREHFQGRYVMTHPAQGDFSCDEGQKYLRTLEDRRRREVDELLALTGWEGKHSENYVKEFSNRIKEERRNEVAFPVIPSPRGPAGMMLLLVGVMASVWWLDRRLQVQTA